MIKFKISEGFVKSANKALINANKLSHVFYNTGQTFLVHPDDFSDVKIILKRNMIKIQA